MNPMPDNHTLRYQFLDPAGATKFTSTSPGRRGFEELVAFVHRTTGHSVVLACTQFGYAMKLVAA